MKKNIFVQAVLSISCIAATTFVMGQNVLKLTPGAVLKTTGGIVITLQDMNLDNDGTISQAAGEGIYKFTGTQNNTISGTSAPLFDILEIAKTGSAKISLQRNINVGSGINFTSGLIDLNNNTIFLQPTALLNGESELSRIMGPAGGFIEITNSLNVPSSVNPGNLGAILTSPENLGTTIIRRGHTSQVNGSGLGSSIFRYYDILPADNTGLNATLRFNYLDAELNGFDENTIVLWKSPDNLHWTQQGFSSRNTSSNYVEKTGLPDFSRWTLSSFNNPLPVLFTLFNVRCTNNAVLISWKTAQELNSARFVIEKSPDGNNWVAIGTLPAAGTSNTERSYSFTDNLQASGALYRIAEYDIDGRVQYTTIIRSDCNSTDTWKLWPNPVTEILMVNITTSLPTPAKIRIADSKGSLISINQHALMPGTNQLHFDLKKLPAGTYHIIAEWGALPIQRSLSIIKIW